LLNDYFVPVYLRNQDYSDLGSAPPEEKAEKNRIYRTTLEAGLPAGTVCVYLLTPEASPIDTAPLNRPEATDPARLAEKLSRVIRDLNIAKREPILQPRPQSQPRSSDPDATVLHLTARYLEKVDDDLVRIDTRSVLGSQKGGNWGDLPSEAWIVLDRAGATKLLPTGEISAGVSWELDRQIAAKFLRHFFPPTENTDFEKNRIDEQSLRARIESIDGSVARASITGRLKMKHPFYHQDDQNFVETDIRGYLEFDVTRRQLRSLRLVTDNAKYGAQTFGVAVRSLP
jgi:hypothetical protein